MRPFQFLISAIIKLFRFGINRNFLFILSQSFVCHEPADFRIERIIRSDADIRPWVNSGTALTHEYRTAGDQFTAVSFNTKPLRIGIPSIPG